MTNHWTNHPSWPYCTHQTRHLWAPSLEEDEDDAASNDGIPYIDSNKLVVTAVFLQKILEPWFPKSSNSSKIVMAFLN